jgi:hypothetical protein
MDEGGTHGWNGTIINIKIMKNIDDLDEIIHMDESQDDFDKILYQVS